MLFNKSLCRNSSSSDEEDEMRCDDLVGDDGKLFKLEGVLFVTVDLNIDSWDNICVELVLNDSLQSLIVNDPVVIIATLRGQAIRKVIRILSPLVHLSMAFLIMFQYPQ